MLCINSKENLWTKLPPWKKNLPKLLVFGRKSTCQLCHYIYYNIIFNWINISYGLFMFCTKCRTWCMGKSVCLSFQRRKLSMLLLPRKRDWIITAKNSSLFLLHPSDPWWRYSHLHIITPNTLINYKNLICIIIWSLRGLLLIAHILDYTQIFDEHKFNWVYGNLFSVSLGLEGKL